MHHLRTDPADHYGYVIKTDVRDNTVVSILPHVQDPA
jgi:hypothetical protein